MKELGKLQQSDLKDVVVASQPRQQEVLKWLPKDRLKLALQCVIN